jgi:hypothetical protein
MDAASRKQMLVALGAIVVITSSGFLVFRTLTRPEFNHKLQAAIGQVMAEETTRLLNGKGRVVVVTLDFKQFPALEAQFKAFKKGLRGNSKITVGKIVVISSEKKRQGGPGIGLSDADYLKLLETDANADIFVSFVGTPDPDDERVDKLKGQPVPKMVALTRARKDLKKLFRREVVQAAVVPRFEFPAPGSHDPSTPREWFDLSCQLLRPESRTKQE